MAKDGTRRGERGEKRIYVRWTEHQREAFLTNLSATCSVSAACAALEGSLSGVYYLRRTDPAFAAAWRTALQTGYDRLEEALLQRAGAATAAAEEALDAGKVDADFAIRLLALHHSRMKAQDSGRTRQQNHVQRATPEETDAALLRQVKIVERRLKAKAERENARRDDAECDDAERDDAECDDAERDDA